MQEKLHWNYEKDSSEIRLDHAQHIFPEAIWEGFKEINLGYDSNKIDAYLKDAIQINMVLNNCILKISRYNKSLIQLAEQG